MEDAQTAPCSHRDAWWGQREERQKFLQSMRLGDLGKRNLDSNMCRPKIKMISMRQQFLRQMIPQRHRIITLALGVIQREGGGPGSILREKLIFERKLSVGTEDGEHSQDRELEFNLLLEFNPRGSTAFGWGCRQLED